MRIQEISYEVIGRAVVSDRSNQQRHYLKLLYRGDGTPWWCCTAGMELMVSADFVAQAGDFVTITVAVEGGE